MSGKNPLQLAAQLKKINECRDKITAISQQIWTDIVSGKNPSFENLLLIAKELDILSPGEGSRTIATIAVNSNVLLRKKFEELKTECTDMRARLAKLESVYDESIIRSAKPSGENTTQ